MCYCKAVAYNVPCEWAGTSRPADAMLALWGHSTLFDRWVVFCLPHELLHMRPDDNSKAIVLKRTRHEAGLEVKLPSLRSQQATSLLLCYVYRRCFPTATNRSQQYSCRVRPAADPAQVCNRYSGTRRIAAAIKPQQEFCKAAQK